MKKRRKICTLPTQEIEDGVCESAVTSVVSFGVSTALLVRESVE